MFDIESYEKIIEKLDELKNELRETQYRQGEKCEELEEINKMREKINDQKRCLEHQQHFHYMQMLRM